MAEELLALFLGHILHPHTLGETRGLFFFAPLIDDRAVQKVSKILMTDSENLSLGCSRYKVFNPVSKQRVLLLLAPSHLYLILNSPNCIYCLRVEAN